MMGNFNAYKMDPEVGAVLVGLDQNFTYTSLAIASLYINNGKRKFICTNE
jgi:ribonucleotide monophosphatase NagD (HAD superfamily)